MSKASGRSIAVGVLAVPALIFSGLFYGLFCFALLFAPAKNGITPSIVACCLIGTSATICLGAWLRYYGKPEFAHRKQAAAWLATPGIATGAYLISQVGPALLLVYPILVHIYAAAESSRSKPTA